MRARVQEDLRVDLDRRAIVRREAGHSRPSFFVGALVAAAGGGGAAAGGRGGTGVTRGYS
jgi:hypothetical protein